VRKSLAVGAVALMLLASCGTDETGDDTSSPSSSDAATSLTIVVTPAEGVKSSTYTLTCDPAGGDHPQAEQACAALDEAGASVFEPVAADGVCTEIYGGPQTATVKGTLDGATIDASFSRHNGCEIDRWEQLGTTFFNVPLQ
jgi:hypothetical protein